MGRRKGLSSTAGGILKSYRALTSYTCLKQTLCLWILIESTGSNPTQCSFVQIFYLDLPFKNSNCRLICLIFQIPFKVEQAPKAALKQASLCAMRAHVSVHVHQAEIHCQGDPFAIRNKVYKETKWVHRLTRKEVNLTDTRTNWQAQRRYREKNRRFFEERSKRSER